MTNTTVSKYKDRDGWYVRVKHYRASDQTSVMVTASNLETQEEAASRARSLEALLLAVFP